MREPPAELRRRRKISGPIVERRLGPADPTRPQRVHQDPHPVVGCGCVVDPFDPGVRCVRAHVGRPRRLCMPRIRTDEAWHPVRVRHVVVAPETALVNAGVPSPA